MTASPLRVLFVCTGNTCRSPLAQAILAHAAAERGLPIAVSSAGTGAWSDAPASDGALLVGLERGLDLNGHRARQLTAAMIDAADLVLAMGPQHVERAIALGGGDRVHLLTEYASRGSEQRAISDPFGGDLEVYRHTADELTRVLSAVIDRLADAEPPGT